MKDWLQRVQGMKAADKKRLALWLAFQKSAVAKGQENHFSALAAYVQFKEGHGAGLSGLKSYLADRLPSQGIPDYWVEMKEMPRMPNGKVNRKGLPCPWSEPVPLSEGLQDSGKERESGESSGNSVLTQVVLGVWREVLRKGRLGMDDSFFENGGHSLLATKALARLRDLFDAELPLRLLFEAPTVRRFAEAMLKFQPQGVSFETAAQWIMEVTEMSDDEVERQLSEDSNSGHAG